MKQPPSIHAGGAEIPHDRGIGSALYAHDLISAVAYKQRAVLDTAQLLARTEGILPAPEAAHAVHGACVAARKADQAGRPQTILVGVSGHGLLDMGSYRVHLDSELVDVEIPHSLIAEFSARLPVIK